MMTEQKLVTGNETAAADTISFAVLPDQIVVVRIMGRGSFHNSVELRSLTETVARNEGWEKATFVIDLGECITMDSTFMGVLASIGLSQLKANGRKMAVVNVNEQNMRLLTTLGLTQFLNVRTANETPAHQASEHQFQNVENQQVDRAQRIIHMIEAHQELCDADPSNNMRFESVLKYLQDSLKHEK